MNKLLTTLAIMGLTYTGVNAQGLPKVCETSSDKVCRMSPDKKHTSCYKTKYSENYKVCKNNKGYFICCETPNKGNSTHPGFVVTDQSEQYDMTDYSMVADAQQQQHAPAVMLAPQSQSYPENTETVIGIGKNYENRNYIRACYSGDNVAMNNRAPYVGCNSPQDDGADKNNARNINSTTPADLPPINGRSK